MDKKYGYSYQLYCGEQNGGTVTNTRLRSSSLSRTIDKVREKNATFVDNDNDAFNDEACNLTSGITISASRDKDLTKATSHSFSVTVSSMTGLLLGSGNQTVTLNVNWKANIYTITLNKNGGSGGTSTIYEKYNTGWYSDSAATSAISSVTVPSKSGYSIHHLVEEVRLLIVLVLFQVERLLSLLVMVLFMHIGLSIGRISQLFLILIMIRGLVLIIIFQYQLLHHLVLLENGIIVRIILIILNLVVRVERHLFLLV